MIWVTITLSIGRVNKNCSVKFKFSSSSLLHFSSQISCLAWFAAQLVDCQVDPRFRGYSCSMFSAHASTFEQVSSREQHQGFQRSLDEGLLDSQWHWGGWVGSLSPWQRPQLQRRSMCPYTTRPEAKIDPRTEVVFALLIHMLDNSSSYVCCIWLIRSFIFFILNCSHFDVINQLKKIVAKKTTKLFS